jgi:hypothetical protein
MSELLSSFKEGYIYKESPRLWIYLGVFNYLKAKPLGNGLYKCVVMENEPKFITGYMGSLIMESGTLFSNEIKPIGCTLEDINTLVESYKKEFCYYYRLCFSSFLSGEARFHTLVYGYIKTITLSKGYIKIPSSFEIVSSDNNSLILHIPNLVN